VPSPSAVLPATAREHAWAALWQRLLQPIPGDTPEPEPREHPDDESTAGDEESAAYVSGWEAHHNHPNRSKELGSWRSIPHTQPADLPPLARPF
jgi:hypothetical protein